MFTFTVTKCFLSFLDHELSQAAHFFLFLNLKSKPRVGVKWNRGKTCRWWEEKRKTRENGLILSHTRLREVEKWERKIPPPSNKEKEPMNFWCWHSYHRYAIFTHVIMLYFSRRRRERRFGLTLLKSLNRLFSAIDPRWLQRKDMVFGTFALSDFSDCAERWETFHRWTQRTLHFNHLLNHSRGRLVGMAF